MDTNGDGLFDRAGLSPERAYARDEEMVFRIGRHYVSVESAELSSQQVVLRERSAADCTRIELTPGTQLPDFPFTDLAGRQHTLSEFRGKYVLISYWSTMCGWAVEEIPQLKQAYNSYYERGFEIVGLLDDELDRARAFVAGEEITWPNAVPDSTRDLVQRRFRFIQTPTLLLLDHQGRIISRGKNGELGLRGAALGKTFASLFPSASAPRH
jgi:peroxiredoxin